LLNLNFTDLARSVLHEARYQVQMVGTMGEHPLLQMGLDEFGLRRILKLLVQADLYKLPPVALRTFDSDLRPMMHDVLPSPPIALIHFAPSYVAPFGIDETAPLSTFPFPFLGEKGDSG
jgi:hypothetical protein